MALTLGLTGMDPATETAIKAAFADANRSLGDRWRLVAESDADHIVVDMDSMYGPMSWLRLHAAGKHVIGLTSAPRTQTEFRLGRPFDAHLVAAMLVDVAAVEGEVLAAAAIEAEPASAPEPVAPEHLPEPESEPAPQPEAEPEPEPEAQAEAQSAPDPDPEPEPEAEPALPTPPDHEPAHAIPAPRPAIIVPALADPPAPVPLPPSREPVFADWLRPGALGRRVRYRRDSGPTVLIDPAAQSWHGPGPLKPVAAYFDGEVRADDFEAIPDAQWATESAALGEAQPLSRLRWLGGLVAGRGSLLPGNDPAGKYVLTRWPQTEREYPRHFRIATAMMKGPATLSEIAAASGMPDSEVADFINANLATGFAEAVAEPPPAAPEPPKPTGLLGRLRGR